MTRDGRPLRISGVMWVWIAGELGLAVDTLIVAAAGLAGSPALGDLRPRGLLFVGAVVLFFLPGEVAVRLPPARTRDWFWVVASVPAVLWVPVAPSVFLIVGPPLASTVGLSLAAVGLIAAVMVVIGGSLAALEAHSRTPEA